MEYTAILVNPTKDAIHNVYWGCIFHDKKERFRDGTRVHTSFVVNVKDGYIETLGSVYKIVEV